MARLGTTKSGGLMSTLIQHLGSNATPSTTAAMNISNESLGFVASGNLENSHASGFARDFDTVLATVREGVKTALATGTASNEERLLGIGGTGTDAQLQAAAYIQMAVSQDKESIKQFHKRGIDTSVSNEEKVAVIGMPTGSGFQYLEANPSLESFDARNIEKMRGINVAVAFAAAIQDEYGEAFYRTVTVTSDTAGFEIETRHTVVEREIEHPQTGQWNGWTQHNLIDAFTDSTILLDDSTKIYPQVIVGDDESEMLFADKADVAPKQILANGGALIWSSMLRPGVSIPLLGVGYNEKIPGKLDQVASIDGDVRLDNVAFKITSSSGESIIPFNTSAFDGNGFYKSATGRDRRMSLDFPFNDFYLDATTLDKDGNPAAALSFLGTGAYTDLNLRLGGLIAGELDTEFGSVLVNPASASVRGVRRILGENDYENITDKVTIKAVSGEITKIELVGFEVDARRANLERRQMGIFCNTVVERTRYMVPLHPPVSIRRPITDTTSTIDVNSALHVVRARNSQHAVSQQFETREVLRQAVRHISYTTPTDKAPTIYGFGRLLVRPVLLEDTVNVADIIQNTASMTQTQNVAAVLFNKIRYMVTKAYTESRYQIALDAINGTAGERPTVVIGTDPTTASYLQVEGDPRAFAALGFKHRIVVSYDFRHRNKIVCGFVRENTSEIDVMSNGVMANIPELVTQIVLPYNGGNTDTTQVQGRTRHIPLLPIQVWLDVEGLEDAASDRADFKVDMG